MRAFTLVSLLIASAIATPTFHSENALARRTTLEKDDLVDVDVKLDADEIEKRRKKKSIVHKEKEPHKSIFSYGLVDLIWKVLKFLGILNEDFTDNRGVINRLLALDAIDADEAKDLGGVDILGLYSQNYGLLSDLFDSVPSGEAVKEKKNHENVIDSIIGVKASVLSEDSEENKEKADDADDAEADDTDADAEDEVNNTNVEAKAEVGDAGVDAKILD